MAVRRGAARIVAVLALLGGMLAVGATPALAEDEDSVRVGAADTFTAGGSPGSVSIEVRKRTDKCVMLRTGLGLRLDGLNADQVKVQVNVGGEWRAVPVSGEGTLATARTSPANPILCKGKSITVRYRVAFLDKAPGGRLTVVGEATTALNRLIGRDSEAARVRGAAKPSPTPSRTASPAAVVAEEESAPPVAALAASPAAASGDDDEGGFGFGTLVMLFGLAMVAVGAALIYLLIRNNRAAADPAATPFVPAGSPGGTVYGSGGPVHSAAGPVTGPVYGAGGPVYGAGGPVPGAGGPVYGAGGPVPGAAGPVYGAGGPVPGAAGPVYGGRGPVPGSGGQPGTYGSGGHPGTPPPAAFGGDDETTVMPRLPG